MICPASTWPNVSGESFGCRGMRIHSTSIARRDRRWRAGPVAGWWNGVRPPDGEIGADVEDAIRAARAHAGDAVGLFDQFDRFRFHE